MTRKNARSRRAALAALQVLIFGAVTYSANAGAQEYYTADRQDWFDDAGAAGSIKTIGFNEIGDDELVTDQYAHFGIHFTYEPGNLGNYTRGPDFNLFPQDGWGLDGNDVIHLVFENPQVGLGFDFPGDAEVELFLNGASIYESNLFSGPGGPGNFGALLGLEFDEAIIFDSLDDQVGLDNLYFVSVPAPPAFGLLVTFLAFRSRRRTPR